MPTIRATNLDVQQLTNQRPEKDRNRSVLRVSKRLRG
jgi:hypothetical protein